MKRLIAMIIMAMFVLTQSAPAFALKNESPAEAPRVQRVVAGDLKGNDTLAPAAGMVTRVLIIDPDPTRESFIRETLKKEYRDLDISAVRHANRQDAILESEKYLLEQSNAKVLVIDNINAAPGQLGGIYVRNVYTQEERYREHYSDIENEFRGVLQRAVTPAPAAEEGRKTAAMFAAAGMNTTQASGYIQGFVDEMVPIHHNAYVYFEKRIVGFIDSFTFSRLDFSEEHMPSPGEIMVALRSVAQWNPDEKVYIKTHYQNIFVFHSEEAMNEFVAVPASATEKTVRELREAVDVAKQNLDKPIDGTAPDFVEFKSQITDGIQDIAAVEAFRAIRTQRFKAAGEALRDWLEPFNKKRIVVVGEKEVTAQLTEFIESTYGLSDEDYELTIEPQISDKGLTDQEIRDYKDRLGYDIVIAKAESGQYIFAAMFDRLFKVRTLGTTLDLAIPEIERAMEAYRESI